MSSPLSLSILDFQHPGASVALACAVEEWGFSRYWIGEHHSTSQCANPLLLGGLLAGTTNRLRIGTGGVSLTYHSALRIAEDARLIEFMIPGRFDLGVTRGLLEDGPIAQALLDGRIPISGSQYAEKVRLLHGLVTGRPETGHALAKWQPYLEEGPPLWLLGLSAESARLAGSLGVGFCFSVHHSGPEIDGPSVVQAYRDSFIPSPELAEPTVIVVVRCLCASSEKEAKSIEAHLVVSPAVPSNQTILGSAAQCSDRITEVARRFSTNEIMVIDFIQKDQDARLEMYRLLSQKLGLEAGRNEGSTSPAPAEASGIAVNSGSR